MMPCEPISQELTKISKQMFCEYDGDKILWMMFLLSTLEEMCKKNKRYSDCIVSKKEMMTERRKRHVLRHHKNIMKSYCSMDPIYFTDKQLQDFYNTYCTNFNREMFPSESVDTPVISKIYPVVFGILSMSKLLIYSFESTDFENAMHPRKIMESCQQISDMLNGKKNDCDDLVGKKSSSRW